MELSKALIGNTKVAAIDLDGNSIGDAGYIELAKTDKHRHPYLHRIHNCCIFTGVVAYAAVRWQRILHLILNDMP